MTKGEDKTGKLRVILEGKRGKLVPGEMMSIESETVVP